jgi:hypothetical protein
MFEAFSRVVLDFGKVIKAEQQAKYRSLSHAAASIRKAEIESITPATRNRPSPPGTPPHTRFRASKRGKPLVGVLPAAIIYVVEGDVALIGPRFSVAGSSGAAHEFGGEYKGALYPARPFALPALKKTLNRFAASWAASIGE